MVSKCGNSTNMCFSVLKQYRNSGVFLVSTKISHTSQVKVQSVMAVRQDKRQGNIYFESARHITINAFEPTKLTKSWACPCGTCNSNDIDLPVW